MAIVYTAVAVVALLAIISLAVDFGRAQAAKSELQAAVDAAAKYGASGLATGVQETINRATSAALDNKIEGTPLALNAGQDIEFGVWDSATRTFTPLTGAQRTGATAVRVTGRRTAERGNPIPTIFAQALGRQSVDVVSVAVATRGKVVTPIVDAKACPWLAGMPGGSTVDPYDGNPRRIYAPDCSPTLVEGIPLTPGETLRFRQTAGSTGDSTTGGNNITLDGDANRMVEQRDANGINKTKAPIGALMGIFLDDRRPDSYAKASAMNFSSANSRNFTTLSPKLKQVFFIGDGVNSNDELQEFVIPDGATRLYLGVMDEKGWWWDNTGQINTTMLDGVVTLVK